MSGKMYQCYYCGRWIKPAFMDIGNSGFYALRPTCPACRRKKSAESKRQFNEGIQDIKNAFRGFEDLEEKERQRQAAFDALSDEEKAELAVKDEGASLFALSILAGIIIGIALAIIAYVNDMSWPVALAGLLAPGIIFGVLNKWVGRGVRCILAAIGIFIPIGIVGAIFGFFYEGIANALICCGVLSIIIAMVLEISGKLKASGKGML